MANQSVLAKVILVLFHGILLSSVLSCSSVRPRIPSLGGQSAQWDADHALIVSSKRRIQSNDLAKAEEDLRSFSNRVVGRSHPLEGVALFYLGEIYFRKGQVDRAQVAYFEAFNKTEHLPQVYSQVFIPTRLYSTRVMLGQMEEAQKLLPTISEGIRKIQGQIRDQEGFAKVLVDLGFLPNIDLLDEEAWDGVRLGQVFLFRAFETSTDMETRKLAVDKFETWHQELQKKLSKPQVFLSIEEKQVPSPELRALERKLEVLGLAHASLIDLSRYQILEKQDEFNLLIQKLTDNYQDQMHDVTKKLPHLRITSPSIFKPRPLGL